MTPTRGGPKGGAPATPPAVVTPDRLEVWVPGADDAIRTVTIRYLVLRALRFFPDHDELYWNVTGNEWAAPIETASARILLPGGDGLKARAFTGPHGSVRSDAVVDIHDGSVRVRGCRPFGSLRRRLQRGCRLPSDLRRASLRAQPLPNRSRR